MTRTPPAGAAGAVVALAVAGFAAAVALADTTPPPTTTIAPATTIAPTTPTVPANPDPAPAATKPAPEPAPPRAKPKPAPKPVTRVVARPTVRAQPPPAAAPTPVYHPARTVTKPAAPVRKPPTAQRVKQVEKAAAPFRRRAHRPIVAPSQHVAPTAQEPLAAAPPTPVAATNEPAASTVGSSKILRLLEIGLVLAAATALLLAAAVPALAVGGPRFARLRLHRTTFAVVGLECAALAVAGRFLFG